MYTHIYADGVPALLGRLADTPEMQRLADVGMHCGTEYAQIQLYKNAKFPYSRLVHSVGVAGIVWRFTGDAVQATAGMLHDISTPVFAHTIDFMNNDHILQESTEDKTRSFIENSCAIMSILDESGISIEDVCDYHMYPIADNDTPMLSADRLEYTLGNGYIVHNIDLRCIKSIYDDLSVAVNENGSEELCFRSVDKAAAFVDLSLRNSYFYVSDENRFLMQYLAEIMRSAMRSGVVSGDDLYSAETAVIEKLNKSEEHSAMWNNYINVSAVAVSDREMRDRFCVNISVKKRYIDPLVMSDGGVRRVSEVDSGLNVRIKEFLDLDFDRWVYLPGLCASPRPWF